MSDITALVGMACVCAVVVSALGVISPNGMTSKTLNLVIGIFIICVMLVPVKNLFTDFSVNLPEIKVPDTISSDARNAYNTAVVTELKARLDKTLLSKLTSEGFSVKTVSVNLDENDDGGIYISSIDIYIDKAEKRIQKIIRSTEESFSVTPKVIARQ